MKKQFGEDADEAMQEHRRNRRIRFERMRQRILQIRHEFSSDIPDRFRAHLQDFDNWLQVGINESKEH